MSQNGAWGGGAWGACPSPNNISQGASPVVGLASIMSEQLQEKQFSIASPARVTTDSDADLAKAIALSLQAENSSSQSEEAGDVQDTDFALALQLQEEEQGEGKWQ